MVVRPETKLLVASSDGRGFVTSGEAVMAETRKGKQLVNLRPGAKVAVVRAIAASADAVAVIGENRKMLVFPLGELPELARGQGVTLQRYRDGGLADATTFRAGRGAELAAWAARAGGRGPRAT